MTLKHMIAAVALWAVCALSTGVLAYGQQPPISSKQIVFEGVGTGTFNSRTMQFDFSVRCYGDNCVGALAFATPGKSAVNYVTGTVTQFQPNTYVQPAYMMSLSSPPSPTTAPPPLSAPPYPPTAPPSSAGTVSCSLVNTPPVTDGETNNVTMTCSAPAGTGISKTAMVLVPQQ
jgi:hypothetical protein